MTKGHEAAFTTGVGRDFGLTVREYFAAIAMQGMLANPYITAEASRKKDMNAVSEVAVISADALIAALNKEAT